MRIRSGGAPGGRHVRHRSCQPGVAQPGSTRSVAADRQRSRIPITRGVVQPARDAGRIDLLVNNAALFGQDGWDDMSGDTLDAHFRLNLFAPVLLSRALVQSAGEKAQPAIVNIVDQRITNPNGDQLSYTLSKQALAGSVRSLAAAFSKRARLNGVAPGLVIPTDDYDDVQMARLNDEMPLGQLPDAKAIAEAVLYLANARHVTGQIIFVDGGAHLRSYKRDFMHL